MKTHFKNGTVWVSADGHEFDLELDRGHASAIARVLRWMVIRDIGDVSYEWQVKSGIASFEAFQSDGPFPNLRFHRKYSVSPDHKEIMNFVEKVGDFAEGRIR